MADSKSKEKEPSGLKKSLRLIYVYAIAAGAIFTFIGYWDTIFYEYCGAGTFFGFILMTLLILPIAMVYCELAPLFPKAGGELIYNTVGINKHVGFFSSWLIMAAWIAVPPSAVMAIVQWMFHVLHVNSSFFLIEGVALVALVGYCCLSLQNVEIAGKIQLYMLIFAIGGCIVATVAFLFSGVWSLDNFKNFFYSQVGSQFGIPSWFIGMALLITPFFGFETVPQMVEEGDFPIKDSNKAILGSIVSCGLVYALFFFGLGGMPVQSLVEEGGAAVNGFLAITMMEQLGGGWSIFAVIFGVAAILCAIGTCLLGFWLSTVRLMYAMGENNFLPKAFTKLNRHQQPVLPNILLLIISLIFLLLQNATTFMNDFFNLMSICSDHDLSHADPQEISAVGISVQIKGRQYHKDPGSADRDHDRILLYTGTERRFMEGIWNLSGCRSCAVAVDGSGKLEETSGRNRNSRRSGEVLGFNLFKTHAGSTAWHKLFQCKGEM